MTKSLKNTAHRAREKVSIRGKSDSHVSAKEWLRWELVIYFIKPDSVVLERRVNPWYITKKFCAETNFLCSDPPWCCAFVSGRFSGLFTSSKLAMILILIPV